MTIQLQDGERLLFESHGTHLPSLDLAPPSFNSWYGALTITDRRIVWTRRAIFSYRILHKIEISLLNIVYLDNKRFLGSRLYLRTFDGIPYAFSVRRGISDSTIAEVESIVRRLHPERFLRETPLQSNSTI